MKVPESTPKGRSGNSNYFVTDPNGTICEIVQYEPNSMSDKNIGNDMPDTRVEIMEAKTVDGNPAPSSTAPLLKYVP